VYKRQAEGELAHDDRPALHPQRVRLLGGLPPQHKVQHARAQPLQRLQHVLVEFPCLPKGCWWLLLLTSSWWWYGQGCSSPTPVPLAAAGKGQHNEEWEQGQGELQPQPPLLSRLLLPSCWPLLLLLRGHGGMRSP